MNIKVIVIKICSFYEGTTERYMGLYVISLLIKMISRENLSNNGNRPFRSSHVPLFQNESKCETFHMKMSSARSFIFMQIKVIFIRMVSHLDSL